VIGYDESRKAFLIMNSWGDHWGDSGFGWIDSSIFDEVVEIAWAPSRLPVRGKPPVPRPGFVEVPPQDRAKVDANWSRVRENTSWRAAVDFLGGPDDGVRFDFVTNEPTAQSLWSWKGSNGLRVDITWDEKGRADYVSISRPALSMPPANPTLVDQNWSRVKEKMHWREVVQLLGGTGEDMRLDPTTNEVKAQSLWSWKGSNGLRVDITWDEKGRADYVSITRPPKQ
jgi:hypothetical protein